jgi:hypothetical protein
MQNNTAPSKTEIGVHLILFSPSKEAERNRRIFQTASLRRNPHLRQQI